MERFLDVDADLVLSHRAGEVRLRGVGRRLVGEVDDFGILPPLARLAPSRPGRRKALLRLDRVLRRVDLDVDLTWRSRSLARIGPSAKPGLTSRLLGVAPLEIRPWTLIRSYVARSFRSD